MSQGKERFVNTSYARSGEQAEVMKEIVEGGYCPFCKENRDSAGVGDPLYETEHWTVVHDRWPYENTARHIVFIARPHVDYLSDMTVAVWTDAFRAISWACKEFEVPGGAIALRFGDSDLTGASVHHLHFHLIVPEVGEEGKAKVVNFPIG